MSKVVSILGCGWLGLPLARHLLGKGYAVRGSSTQQEKLESLSREGIDPYLIQLSTAESTWPSSFFDADVLVVLVPPRSRTAQPGDYYTVMRRLVHHVNQHRSIQHLIYTSSTSVYPDVPGFATEQSAALPSVSAHPELVQVEMLWQTLPGKTSTILRLGGLTGGSRLLVRHFAGKKDLKGGSQPVNLVHWEDAVGVVEMALRQRWEGVYNVCSPEHPFKRDFYTRLALEKGFALPEFLEEQEEGKTVSTEKLKEKGYAFQFKNPYDYTYGDEDQ